MSDAQIIDALGFDPGQMKPHRSYGADGHGTSYETSDGQWISITRSASTGTYVKVWDAHGSQGNWDLGFR